MRKANWLQTPTVLWLGGGIISPSHSTCMGLRMLDWQKYTQQNHWYLSQVPVRELAIDKLKSHKSPGIDQIPAELIKAGVKQFSWRFINLLLLFGRRRNCLKSGRSRS